MGIITAIQRFSLNDGPGIRTTVFFKGCNMACKWCHNPETLSSHTQLHVYGNKCIFCGACIPVCPTQARRIEENALRYDWESCIHCGKCADVCFSGALALAGEEITPEEVMQQIRQDIPYYKNSGGGVTLSGGEVLLQADFAAEILKACKAEGIATAIESNLHFDFSVIQKVLPHLDLVMADLKIEDEALHREMTGLGNALVKENIRRLDALGIPLIIRTPVIPGVNANVDEIGRIARFLGACKNLQYYELLNFNPLGASKYESLALANAFAQTRPLPAEEMEALAAAARAYVPTVKIG